MPIAFQCPNCGKQFKLDDSLASKTAKCPCGTMIAIPDQVPPAAVAPAPAEVPVLTPRPTPAHAQRPINLAQPQYAQPQVPVAPVAQPAPVAQAAPMAQAPVAQTAYAGPQQPLYQSPAHPMTSADIMLMIGGILGAIHAGVAIILHLIDTLHAIRDLTRGHGFEASQTVHSVVHLLLNLGLLVVASFILACAIALLCRKRWGLSVGGPMSIAFTAVLGVFTVYQVVMESQGGRFGGVSSDRIAWLIIRCVLLIAVPIFTIVLYAMRLRHSRPR